MEHNIAETICKQIKFGGNTFGNLYLEEPPKEQKDREREREIKRIFEDVADKERYIFARAL